MTIAMWCVLIAALMPYVATLTAKGGTRSDNANPREWLAKQTGFRARANAAQKNGFEAFPFFAAAVIIAHLTGAPQDRVDILAVAFILARVLHFGFYLANKATLRSVAWIVGFGCTVAIFVAGA
jgi:uncharacterized MAPEG superfamily protein